MKIALKITFGCLWCGLVACSHTPTAVEQRRAQRHEQDSIALVQQLRSVEYNDSLLHTLLPQVDSLLSFFVYEKNAKYTDKGYYIHRSLTTPRCAQYCFLQPSVRDDGQLVVRSFYYGERAIRHTRVQLASGDVTSSFVGSLYAFEADGQYEITTMDEKEASELLHFVDGFAQSRIVVTLQGKGIYRYVLPANEVAAMVETYRLAVLIKDVQRVEAQGRQASFQVQKYKKRLQKAF